MSNSGSGSVTPRSPRSRSPRSPPDRKAQQVTARLIVRRVRDANPDHVTVNAQGELFRVWRHHAVFTDSPLPMLAAEADHRRHAIIEQVIADLKNGPLAHLPSGHFAANSAWLVLAAIAFNLTRAAGALASSFHAKATTATIRDQLINIAARVTRSARRTTLRLPAAWPWAAAWQRLFTAAIGPPAARLTHPPPPGPTGDTSGNAEQIGRPTTTSTATSPSKIKNVGQPSTRCIRVKKSFDQPTGGRSRSICSSPKCRRGCAEFRRE